MLVFLLLFFSESVMMPGGDAGENVTMTLLGSINDIDDG
jgi:hypothetical protein